MLAICTLISHVLPSLSLGLSLILVMMTCCDRTYTPCLDDVGSFLALYWVPIREDGKRGKPLISVCDNPVAPGDEVVAFVLSSS